jgi:radical SAM protein (TIGR01212 family)
VFCDPESFSPSRRLSTRSITAQLDEGIRRLRQRRTADCFLAYFQPATNTYAPVERLRAFYEEAIAHEDVVGLIVGTRPDCVPDPVLDLLAQLAQRTWLTVEFGLQSIHERSLAWMNRGHGFEAFLDAVQRTRQWGIAVGAHVILGLPGETSDDMRATARKLAGLDLHCVKLHNLYAAKGTPLAAMVAAGAVELPSREAYASWVVDFLEQIPSHFVVDRLSADAPREYLAGPTWCLDKLAVHQAIDQEFARRGSWQSSRFSVE